MGGTLVVVLKEAEVGTSLADLICKVGIKEQIFNPLKEALYRDGIGTIMPMQAPPGGDCLAQTGRPRSNVDTVRYSMKFGGSGACPGSDNGREITNQIMDHLANQHQAKLDFS